MNAPSTSYRCRSDPQMLVLVTRIIASVGSLIAGSGTVSTDTFRRPCHVTARIAHLLCEFSLRACPLTGAPNLGSGGVPHQTLLHLGTHTQGGEVGQRAARDGKNIDRTLDGAGEFSKHIWFSAPGTKMPSAPAFTYCVARSSVAATV